MPYSVLGADDTAVNKPAKIPALMDLIFQSQYNKISKNACEWVTGALKYNMGKGSMKYLVEEGRNVYERLTM